MSKRPIPILMYHSIESMPRSTVMKSIHVSPNNFMIQMWLLKMLGFKGLSMRDLMPYIEGEKTGKVVGITFDDGYQNNLINAANILKKYKFTSTCYLVSQRIGLSNIWDINKGITQRPLMTKLEIREWLNMGQDIGAHSQTHANLDDLSEEKSYEEIFDCKKDLEHDFKLSIKDFCYPFGRFNREIEHLVHEAGFVSATTMARGRVKTQSNRLLLPRVHVTNRTLPHLFLAKILTNYEDKR